MSTPEPTFDVARGDLAVSRQLSDTLRHISANVSDPALKAQIGAVLSGNLGVRDFARSDAFSHTLDRVMPSALADYLAMPEEQRRQLAEQGEADLEHYRAQMADPTPPAARTTAPETPSPGASQQPQILDSADTTAQLIPGTRKPNRERVVMPDEPDDDDIFFQDRRRRGWLE